MLGSCGLFLTFGRDEETAHSLKALPSTPSFSPESKITSGRYAEKLDHFLHDAIKRTGKTQRREGNGQALPRFPGRQTVRLELRRPENLGARALVFNFLPFPSSRGFW